jgi:hypothetical protein
LGSFSKDIIEVLPGRLQWAPGLQKLPADSKGTLIDALTLCSDDDQVAKYAVHHYDIPATVFGPLSLAQTVGFCWHVRYRLLIRDCDMEGPLVLTTQAGDSRARTSAAVLIGAYLAFCQNWSAKQIREALGSKESMQKFPCSWVNAQPEADLVMTVQCCWEGFEAAWQHGWLDHDCLNDDQLMASFCRKYDEASQVYDASWLVPGEILVSSDPVTTVCDPDPVTCKGIFPWEMESWCQLNLGTEKSRREEPFAEGVPVNECERKKVAQGVPLAIKSIEPRARLNSDENYGSDDHTPRLATGETYGPPCITREESDNDSLCSEHTVCKVYPPGSINSSNRPSGGSFNSKSFVEFLMDGDIRRVLRMNFPKEGGMVRPTYDGNNLARYGIVHKDIPVLDKLGGLPKREDVAQMLRICEAQGATLFHCKGGFGRSVVLACCLLIVRYNVTGKSLLGWVRVVRPGSITTPQQEKFLCSLNGAIDVLRFAGLSDGSAGCRPAGCAVM